MANGARSLDFCAPVSVIQGRCQVVLKKRKKQRTKKKISTVQFVLICIICCLITKHQSMQMVHCQNKIICPSGATGVMLLVKKLQCGCSADKAKLSWFFICAWTNGWVNYRDAGDLRRHRAHYDVTLISIHIPHYYLTHYYCVKILFSECISTLMFRNTSPLIRKLRSTDAYTRR